MADFSLAELVKINDENLADAEMNELIQVAPFAARLPSVTASNGTTHKYLKKTSAPTVGFRAVNAGIPNSVSGKTLVTAEMEILSATFDIDQQIAKNYKGGASDFLSMEGMEHFNQAMFAFEQQLINGKVGATYSVPAGLAAGFEGFADILTPLSHDMVLDAGGTTADTATSIYLVFEHNTRGVAGVVGNDGNFEWGESIKTRLVDGTGKIYTGYHTPIEGYAGCQLGTKYSIARIANLTEDAGKGATDALLYKALQFFPVGHRPTAILMTRRSQEQIRSGRTATNQLGTPAPTPTSLEGIPFIVCESISNVEPLLA